MLDEEIILIDEYFKYIDSVECNRQNNAVKLFKKYYEILKNTFYLQPDDIRKLMENKIMVKLISGYLEILTITFIQTYFNY
jgi:hypothetical protein